MSDTLKVGRLVLVAGHRCKVLENRYGWARLTGGILARVEGCTLQPWSQAEQERQRAAVEDAILESIRKQKAMAVRKRRGVA